MEDGRSSTSVLRLFVAISPPENVKDQIEKAQQQLRRAASGNIVRWTKRDQFHLTLKFLGNVEATRVKELTQALHGACLGTGPLRLRAEQIGFFPGARVPRVLWVGVNDEQDKLSRLQNSVEMNVKKFTDENAAQPRSAGCASPGVPPASSREKFTGHITLGRIQRIRRLESEALSKATAAIANPFFGEWTANHIELIRSELSSTGSRYTTLAEIPLIEKQ
ncbi:MAG TPA: RNA 2',3'-cyclic phosphodiesterase [Verrucomicrobiae bacterium]|jgi:2'-5' RNA ligase